MTTLETQNAITACFSMQGWFNPIEVSTLLAYQPHVINVIGALVLVALCLYFFQPTPLRLSMTPNYHIGKLYAAATVIFLGLAVLLWPWGTLILWPAVATALITAGYFFLGPGVFRKSKGRLPLSSRIVLFPVLLSQYLSLMYYRRQCNSWDQITPNVWIGRRLNNYEAKQAVAEGVTSVLDLSIAFSEAKPFLATNYFHLPILDLTAPTQAQLQQAVQFLEAESANGVVYVHCKIGYSRSAAVTAAWLMHSGKAKTVDEAVAQLRAARPSIVIRPEIRVALDEFEKLAV